MPAISICGKCGRPAWQPDVVERPGKSPGVTYRYRRWRHPKDGRTKRNKTCYLRLEPPSVDFDKPEANTPASRSSLSAVRMEG